MNTLNRDNNCPTSSTGNTVLDVGTTNELNNGCLPNEENDPFVALPLLAQQSFATNETACSTVSRANMYRKYGISQGARDGGANMAKKILASLEFTEPGFTDVINMAGISH